LTIYSASVPCPAVDLPVNPSINLTQPEELTVLPAQPYATPAITHELSPETRAGSPFGHDSIFDPLGLDPTGSK
jgi:hypothetical protein